MILALELYVTKLIYVYTVIAIFLSTPEMQDFIILDLYVVIVISPEDNFSVRNDTFNLFSPVHLEFSIGTDTVVIHPLFDSRLSIPTTGEDFIYSKMDIRRILKKFRDLFNNFLCQGPDTILRKIHLMVVSFTTTTQNTDTHVGGVLTP